MAKFQINLIQTPSQTLSVNLTDANGITFGVDINLRTLKDGSLIMDLSIDNVPQFYGHACIDRIPMLLNNRLNGNIYFEDQYGNNDPDYLEFNDRYLLIYDDEYVL